MVYLEEKYNKEFVINKSKKNNSSGLYIMNVSPKSDLEQKFFVSLYERDRDFHDDYLKTIIAEKI